MKRKNKVIPSKCFKRFLKEKGILAFFMRTVKPKDGIKAYFRTTKPTNYISHDMPMSESLTMEEQKLSKDSLLTYSEDWKTFYEIMPQLNIIKGKFIMFLKKRDIYNLYLSCFDKTYVTLRIQYERRFAQWSNSHKIISISTDTPETWEDINPKYYLSETFDTTYTIKNEYFWKELNIKWQRELNKYIS